MSDFLTSIPPLFERLAALPFLLLLVLLTPLVVLGAWRRIFPELTFWLVAVVPLALTLGLLFGRFDMLLAVVLAIDFALLVVASVDLFTLPRSRSFTAERQALRIASLQKGHPVTLTITNVGPRAAHVTVRDDVPQEFSATPHEFAARLGPRSRATFHYELKASRRGAFQMHCVYLKVQSRLGLWQRYLRYPVASQISVYPDMKQLAQYAVLARTNRLSLLGVRRTRKIGQDNEFERLRDYTPDDNYKHIDWRTTARRSRLTVKDFQTNQSQRLMFLIDCGRMMTNLAGGVSLLDHSLNAMLMLSYVALKQGDSVGLLCFSDEIHAYVPPQGTMGQMNQLLHASYNRFPRLVESRYDEAFLYLGAHSRKRSLVILVSNIIDEVNAHQLQSYLNNLVGKHLPLGVLLRDRRLFEEADRPSPQGLDLYRAAAAADMLSWRHQVLVDMEHAGVMALDVYPEDMTAPMVNMYLNIKARHLL